MEYRGPQTISTGQLTPAVLTKQAVDDVLPLLDVRGVKVETAFHLFSGSRLLGGGPQQTWDGAYLVFPHIAYSKFTARCVVNGGFRVGGGGGGGRGGCGTHPRWCVCVLERLAIDERQVRADTGVSAGVLVPGIVSVDWWVNDDDVAIQGRHAGVVNGFVAGDGEKKWIFGMSRGGDRDGWVEGEVRVINMRVDEGSLLEVLSV